MRNAIGGNREGENATAGVPFKHHLGKSPVENIHLNLKLAISGIFGVIADNNGFVTHIGRGRQIKGQVGKRGLETDPGGYVQIKDKLLKGLFDLFMAQVIIANKGCQQGIEI